METPVDCVDMLDFEFYTTRAGRQAGFIRGVVDDCDVPRSNAAQRSMLDEVSSRHDYLDDDVIEDLAEKYSE